MSLSEVHQTHGNAFDSSNRIWVAGFINPPKLRMEDNGTGREAVAMDGEMPKSGMRQVSSCSHVDEAVVAVNT